MIATIFFKRILKCFVFLFIILTDVYIGDNRKRGAFTRVRKKHFIMEPL